MFDQDQTNPEPAEFDFTTLPVDKVLHDRRTGGDRRDRQPVPAAPEEAATVAKAPPERRAKKERRRRIDPTTFEKQYTDDELEFMNAMQRFKVQTGESFPSHGDVLRVAASLGYRKFDEADSA